MKGLVVLMLRLVVLTAAFVGVASAQSPHKGILMPLSPVLAPFSAEMNFMSQAGYVRYQNYLQTDRWKGSRL